MTARGFASDNSATIHPDVLAAIARVNVGHTFGYGHDDYTLSVQERVAAALADVPGLTITRPVETNAVFATLPPAVIESLQAQYPFYTWDEAVGEVRWMCSWDTTEEDVDGFAAAVRGALAA